MEFETWKDKPVHCAGLGEVLFDIFPYTITMGGAPANFAYYCSQMGFASLIVSAVGHDERGEEVRQQLALKYMPALLPSVDYQTGAVHITLDRNGVASYSFLNDTAYDHIPITEYLLEVARMTNVACFGTLAQRSEETRKAIETFLKRMPQEHRIRMFDVNLRANFYSDEMIDSSLKLCEVLKCNADELPVLAKAAGIRIVDPHRYYAFLQKEYGINCMIYTEGAVQSFIFLNNDVSVRPTNKIDVVDTVGAGDSFGAACLCALLSGMSLAEAHAFASDVAAFVCLREGAMPEFPDTFKLMRR